MTGPHRNWKLLLSLGVLLTGAACTEPMGQEPLYVLRDAQGRSVAMAGRSQLGNAAPGTMVRASFGGTEQDVMVGERIGMGPVVRPGASPTAEPMMANAAVSGAPIASAAIAPAVVTPAASEEAAPAAGERREGRSRGVRGSSGRPVQAGRMQEGMTPGSRRREAPPRSVSRSVM